MKHIQIKPVILDVTVVVDDHSDKVVGISIFKVGIVGPESKHWYVSHAWWTVSTLGASINVKLSRKRAEELSLADGFFVLIPMHNKFQNELDLPTLTW